MYLKTITVAGFKSFAAKTSLDFEPGIMAIVGPNGSGKSNLADAVRWALGEQSKGRLRLNDREEIVFAGSTKQAKASFAEVSLLFDNQDGAFGLDLSEVEISRRLYRSGESEYRLAGRVARLSDITTHLAEAGFGAGSYAVIGQGTIDSFIMSSPSERKLLFDEAAGIRGAELKRETSLRKLSSVESNLVRLRDINLELEPRLASLARGMAAVREQQELEAKLSVLRQEFLDTATAGLIQEGIEAQARIDDLGLELGRLEHERRAVADSQDKRLREASEAAARSHEANLAVTELEDERNAFAMHQADISGRTNQLESAQVQVESLLARRNEVRVQLNEERKKLGLTHKNLSRNNAAAVRARESLGRAAERVAEVQAELVSIRHEASDGTQSQYVSHALLILRTIAHELNEADAKVESIRLLVHKAGRLLSHADRRGEAEILQRIRSVQEQLEEAMSRRETAIEHQGNFTITRRSLELDQAHQEEAIHQLEPVLAEIEARITGQDHQTKQLSELKNAAIRVADEMKHVETRLEAARSKLQIRTVDELQIITEEATRLERLKSHEAIARLELEASTQRLLAQRSELTRLQARVSEWGIEPRPEWKSDRSVELMNQELVELEAKVVARQQLQSDTQVEYDEVFARQSELSTQLHDLETARADLVQLVAELAELIQARFKVNFARLAEEFSRFFVRLFEGGSATLELIEGEDGAYGIEIKASPKGKRLASLTALSGGERALTGVALLAAILSVNPSPFVVLDEIDAALDEANSGRLADIMVELQERSQLIVITHNRQTMQSARSLFGVTMNDQHTSHVISMRLEDAAELAAR
jgi:chromosome segregation protein